MHGKCISWSRAKGYGYIATDSGEQLFCHYTALPGTGQRWLEPGQVVTFERAEIPGAFEECTHVQLVARREAKQPSIYHERQEMQARIQRDLKR